MNWTRPTALDRRVTGRPYRLMETVGARKDARILVVDDDLRNLRLMEALLKAEGYEVETLTTAESALARVPQMQPALIILDVMLPGMDGNEVAGRLKRDPQTQAIPIIMLTALDTRDAKLAALNMGAEEFLSKPIDRAELWVRVRNLLRLKEYSDFLAEHNRILDEQVRERTEQLTRSFRETISAMNRASSYRDEETGAHVQRISHYCVELARALGLDEDFRDCIFYASPMHDVGKIAIPDHVLFKPGSFTPEEWRIMKTHAELGARMLEGSDSPYMRMGRDIALCHHERWDGTGYPAGLTAERIPLAARLMAMADVYDALRSRRPYKPPFDHVHATRIILEGDGRTERSHFDPQVLDAFGRCLPRIGEIYAELTKDEPAGGASARH